MSHMQEKYQHVVERSWNMIFQIYEQQRGKGTNYTSDLNGLAVLKEALLHQPNVKVIAYNALIKHETQFDSTRSRLHL